MRLSIISPVYRAESCLRPLYTQLTEVAQAMEDVDDYEIIFVEDRGGDRSWEIIQELAAADSHLIGLQLSRNFGQHHALTAGLDICSGDWVVTMDCDLQDRPQDIPALWQEAQKGFNVVNARRRVRIHGLHRRLASRSFHLVFGWLSGLAFDPRVANFRLIERHVVEAYKALGESTRSVGSQIHWMGFSTSFVEVTQEGRYEGESSYSLRKLLVLAVDTIVSYSNKHLRYSIGLGLCMTIIAICTSGWIYLRALFLQIPVPGWASLMVSLWFIGGIVTANLGIIGIYVGKIYDETKGRPIYIIENRING